MKKKSLKYSGIIILTIIAVLTIAGFAGIKVASDRDSLGYVKSYKILSESDAWHYGNDANTKLLLHCNGTDASTSFPDDSVGGGHTMTANGDAQVDTSVYKFATGSLLLDGTGDTLTTPDSADWGLGTTFTIDCWVYFNSVTECVFIGQRQASDDYWRFGYIDNAGTKYLRFDGYDAGFEMDAQGIWTPSTTTWYHVCVTSNGSEVKLYVDGTELSYFSQSWTSGISDRTGNLEIGGFNSGLYLNGQMDEIRIEKGVVAWTSNFTPSGRQWR